LPVEKINIESIQEKSIESDPFDLDFNPVDLCSFWLPVIYDVRFITLSKTGE